eukprot:2189141-Amphidinium_carterae.2
MFGAKLRVSDLTERHKWQCAEQLLCGSFDAFCCSVLPRQSLTPPYKQHQVEALFCWEELLKYVVARCLVARGIRSPPLASELVSELLPPTSTACAQVRSEIACLPSRLPFVYF